VPFHLWSPDVYEGAPTPVTGIMASIVKVGAFAAFLRVLISALGTQLDTWRPILFVLVVLTCVVGASVALVQRNVKRLLAYSSINQAGFMLLGVWSGSARGVASTLFYLMTYAPVVVATFAVVTLIGGTGDELHSIDHYRGLARRQPWLGGALAVLLFSQLGAPLTVGFYAKYSVLAATIDSGGGALALVAILSAAIAAFFYLRWILTLYADDDVEGTRVHVPLFTGKVIAVGVIVAILFGLWPGPLATWTQHATLLFLP
jgi:NADH-quinone oxidoreductase subunit N